MAKVWLSSSGSLLRQRYRHVVVDEAQDLSAAHWKMLRAMVPAGRDDMFLAGDTHQRKQPHDPVSPRPRRRRFGLSGHSSLR